MSTENANKYAPKKNIDREMCWSWCDSTYGLHKWMRHFTDWQWIWHALRFTMVWSRHVTCTFVVLTKS